jgi:hypothetical protein
MLNGPHRTVCLPVCSSMGVSQTVGSVTTRSPVEDYEWFRVIVLHGTPMLGVSLASVTYCSPVEDYEWFRVIVLHGTPALGCVTCGWG